jgi:hypothetical protein
MRAQGAISQQRQNGSQSHFCPWGGRQTVRLSTPGETPIFFMIRLMERLRECGSAPAVDLMEYGRGLESFGEEWAANERESTRRKGFPQSARRPRWTGIKRGSPAKLTSARRRHTGVLAALRIGASRRPAVIAAPYIDVARFVRSWPAIPEFTFTTSRRTRPSSIQPSTYGLGPTTSSPMVSRTSSANSALGWPMRRADSPSNRPALESGHRSARL